MSYFVAKELTKRLRMGHESMEDDARAGKTVEVFTDENIALVEDPILGDRRLKIKEIAQVSDNSDTTIRRNINEHLNMNKVSVR